MSWGGGGPGSPGWAAMAPHLRPGAQQQQPSAAAAAALQQLQQPAPALFEADHVSHAKVMRACEEALAKVDGAAPDLRRQVVLILPLFYRLRSVLEHHTLREQRFLYPRLDAELSPGEIEVLVTELTTPGES